MLDFLAKVAKHQCCWLIGNLFLITLQKLAKLNSIPFSFIFLLSHEQQPLLILFIQNNVFIAAQCNYKYTMKLLSYRDLLPAIHSLRFQSAA